MRKVWLSIVSIIILLEVILFGNGAKFISSPPKIGVIGSLNGRYLSPRAGEDSKDVNLTLEGVNTYLAPSRVGQITLECNASYPVMWNLLDSKVAKLIILRIFTWRFALLVNSWFQINSEIFPYIYVRTKRFASDLFDATTYNYSAEIVLGGPSSPHKFTGNYSCQNTAKKDVQSNVFIYWEGTCVW